METTMLMSLAGVLALAGAVLYALGDVLMLAWKVGPVRGDVREETFAALPELQSRAAMFAGLARIPERRLVAGGMAGVFAAPLSLAGLWLLYQGLAPAGAWLALPPVLLFGYGTVIGPFLHGSFIFVGDSARRLTAATPGEQALLASLIARWRALLIRGFLVLFALALLASVWFSVAVATGVTVFPLWMAAANPATLFAAWMLGRRLLPQRVRDATEGAGLNIANGIFYALVLAALLAS
jgi:hypothetical protein